MQIVWNFLQQKGLSSDQTNRPAIFSVNTVFKLPADQLTIRVHEFSNEDDSGFRVEIGRVTGENWSLVQSIQKEIDDAFGPKGLV